MSLPEGRLVVGIGNRGRGDDGIGPLVAQRVAALRLPGVEVVLDAEPLDLLALLERSVLMVVVDAVAPQGSPGRVTVAAVEDLTPGEVTQGGTHGFGVLETVALARAVGRLCAHVVVVGVEAATLESGASLSADVAGALDTAVQRVRGALSSEALAVTPP